ncbi:MAG: methyltransferase domain-containing protein [Patescibacteria group bacterium]
MDNPKADKWNGIFSKGTAYRELNEVFILDLLDAFAKISGRKPSAVVDLGCGSGDTLARFTQLGIPVTGVDISNIAIEKAKERLKAVDHDAECILHDLDNIASLKLNAPEGALWMCKLVLAFISDRRAFLENVHVKMKSGDQFLIMTPVLHDEVNYTKEDKPGIAIPIKEIESLLTDIFGSFMIFSNEYTGERMHVISYFVGKK